MKGINHYNFNHATAEEAFEAYINEHLVGDANKVVVKSVTYHNNVFDVAVSPPEKKHDTRAA